jgi:16S rRNA processing protein RimM
MTRDTQAPHGEAPRGRLVAIGEVARPHGLRGELRVRPLTDHPERFERVRTCVLWEAARDERRPCRVAAARRQGDAVIVALEGCHSPEAASALVGRLLAVPEAEAEPLPPGHFYPWQLEGARVVTEDGAEVGRVVGIERAAAQEWWVVGDGVREHLIPAVPEIVVDVDLAAARVVIRPPEGLLEL